MMKRTRQYLMILATAAALFLWGEPGKLAKAQLQPQYLNANSVGHVYGAGESTLLNGNAGPVGVFASGTSGGTLTGGTNIVINSYNGGGQFHDYTNLWHATWSGSYCSDAPEWNATSGINWSLIRTDISNSHPAYPCNKADNYTYRDSGSFVPYTTTLVGTDDDGVPLLQIASGSSPVVSEATFGTRGTPPLSGSGLTDYTRPTTINIQGATSTTLDYFHVGDLRWYYRTYTLQQ